MKTEAYIIENSGGRMRYTAAGIIRRTQTTLVVLELEPNGKERTFTLPKFGDRIVERGKANSYHSACLTLDTAGCEKRKAEAEAARALYHRSSEVARGLDKISRSMTWNGQAARREEEIAACEALIALFQPATEPATTTA